MADYLTALQWLIDGKKIRRAIDPPELYFFRDDFGDEVICCSMQISFDHFMLGYRATDWELHEAKD